MMILDEFPSVEEFYKTYWGKKPFVVRGAIDKNIFGTLIDGDSLAGLSLEEDIKSRIVISEDEGQKWTCHHGPFDADKFSTLGEKNWSLLVQNVEQYHIDTAQLLKAFYFSPRWLMDDIMVSYSTAGGGVGPHTDSYHVFLVQGHGRRQWTIGLTPMENGDCIEGLDLQVLKDGVEGSKVEVSMGDVLYLPPHFAHEGVTIEESLTFSVGFLGPHMSELLIEYGHYLSANKEQDKRYDGKGLNKNSSAFSISPQDQKILQSGLIDSIQSNDFSKWLATYFSTPTHDEVENIEARENILSSKNLFERVQNGEKIYRPEHIKIAVTTSLAGDLNLAVYGHVIPFQVPNSFIHWLNKNTTLSIEDIKMMAREEDIMPIVTFLYNQNVLFFENENLIP